MKEQITESTLQLLKTIDSKLRSLEERFEFALIPARENVLRRFPVLFILLTTFGVVATFLGMELLIERWLWLYERPGLVLLVGIGTLVATGTLYRKLG